MSDFPTSKTNLDLHCAHGKPVYARCEQCEDDVKAGKSTGFTRPDQPSSKEHCQTCGNEWDAPLRAEIERLQQDVARYESGREALCIVIDMQKDKIKQLESKLVAAGQLAVRQACEIRRLRGPVKGEPA